MKELRVLLCLLGFGLLLSGCGRDELSGRCSSDDECASGRLCVGGMCTSEDDLPDVGDEDSSSGCTSDDDCGADEACDVPAGECVSTQCREVDAMCVQSVCDENGCSEEMCVVDCKPGSEQMGCSCAPIGCSTDDECDGAVCVDGSCEPCMSDDQCPDPDESCLPDGTCGEDLTCQDDTDCGAQRECDDGTCVDRPECVIDDDCGNEELCFNGRCTHAPECSESDPCPNGFECVGGNCFEEVCRGPEDCEAGEVCDGGECRIPPPAISCFVATPDGLISEGQRVSLEAFAVDGDGNGVAATFDWSSDDSDVASIDSNGPAAVGGTKAGTAVLTAQLATGDPIVCDGEVELTNPGDVTPNQMRVVVTHAETGAPVANATVVAGSDSAVTSAGGVADLPEQTGDYDVSVFHDDFNWVTIQGVDSDDIRIPVQPRSGAGPIAGMTGEFDTSALHSSGDFTIGLAGLSLAGGLIDLELTRLLGDPFVRPLSIPGVVDTDVPLPGGIILYGSALGFTVDLKRTYYASAADGARVAWGLAGEVPFAELFSLFQGGGGGSTGDVLATLLPLFNRFDHGSNPLNLVAQARVTDSMDIDGDNDTTEKLPDYANFPVVDLKPSVRQNLVTDVTVSNFPALSDGTAELAVLVGGTSLDSPGFVPLGISATTDEDGDGRPDARRLSIAPPYASLTGGRFAVMAIAFNADGGGFGGQGFELPAELSAALWNGQSFASDTALGTFPDSSVVSVDDANRTVTFTADAGPVYRARIIGATRTWDVWSQGPPGNMGTYNHTISIPAPPATRPDIFVNGGIHLDAIQTNVDIDDLVKATGFGLDNAGIVSTAFNRTEVRAAGP